MRVLLAIDFSPASDRTIKACAELSWPVGTIVRVLGVVEKIPPSAAELWYDSAGILEEVWKARKERVEELVLNAAEALRNKGLTTETSVQIGRRRKIIALEEKSWRADIVVNAARGEHLLNLRLTIDD
jgi:nucleotide-binding universal stress UspA family protein